MRRDARWLPASRAGESEDGRCDSSTLARTARPPAAPRPCAQHAPFIHAPEPTRQPEGKCMEDDQQLWGGEPPAQAVPKRPHGHWRRLGAYRKRGWFRWLTEIEKDVWLS